MSSGKNEKGCTESNKDSSQDESMDDLKNISPPGENIFVQQANVVRRSKWGARWPDFNAPLKKLPVDKVVITWTETEGCFTEEECIARVKQIQCTHMDKDGEPDIRHNFLLGGDGSMYEGRGYTAVGTVYPKDNPKTAHLNGESIEIAFIDKCTNKPTPALLKALSECMSFGMSGNFIDHRSTCYWMAKNDVIHIMPAMLPGGTPKKPILTKTT